MVYLTIDNKCVRKSSICVNLFIRLDCNFDFFMVMFRILPKSEFVVGEQFSESRNVEKYERVKTNVFNRRLST